MNLASAGFFVLWLCEVNRQINYIIYAFLFLFAIGSGFWLLQELFVTKAKTTEPVVTIPTNQNTELSVSAAKGKTLFMSKCAACHVLNKDMTGPGLFGFTEREPWTDRKNVYEWIRNPSAFMEKNENTRNLKKVFGAMMTGFPDMTDEEIDSICDYINQSQQILYETSIAER